MKKFNELFVICSVLIGLGLAIYHLQKLGKFLSYEFFYKDQVKETIRQMVKPEELLESKPGRE
jgi:hypothetical protein